MTAHKHHRFIHFCLLLCSCVLFHTPLAAQPVANEDKIEATEDELAQVRRRIQALQQVQKDLNAERNQAVDELRDVDRDVARITQDAANIERSKAATVVAIDQLKADQNRLASSLGGERASLAELLRLAYRQNRDHRLKLLFAQDEIKQVERVMTYQKHLLAHQKKQIDHLTGKLDALMKLVQEQKDLEATLKQQQNELNQQANQLEKKRLEREQVIQTLESQLAENQTSIADLTASEKRLQRLIETLSDVLSDIPDDLMAAQAFKELRGRLIKPINARLLAGFGHRGLKGEKSRGHWYNAAPNQSIQAPASGRVAFAEWMSGYGLMLILDHGDEYMSIYAHQDALMVELGDWVEPGQVIGRAGSSGGLNRNALYFELRYRGKPTNPRPWLMK